MMPVLIKTMHSANSRITFLNVTETKLKHNNTECWILTTTQGKASQPHRKYLNSIFLSCCISSYIKSFLSTLLFSVWIAKSELPLMSANYGDYDETVFNASEVSNDCTTFIADLRARQTCKKLIRQWEVLFSNKKQRWFMLLREEDRNMTMIVFLGSSLCS